MYLFVLLNLCFGRVRSCEFLDLVDGGWVAHLFLLFSNLVFCLVELSHSRLM